MTLALADLALLGPALAAGLLVVATHVPLGREVLARGIIFIDLAVAQFAGAGAVAAYALTGADGGWPVQAAAFAAALAGAGLLRLCERWWPEVLEALIGVLFVLAATGGLLLLAGHPQGAERLRELLVGQVLWVGYGDLLPVALLYAGVLVVWFGRPAWRRSMVFYGLFAVTVTASVQLVGVYLVFASLIVPALAVRGAPDGRGMVLGCAVGATGYAAGLAGSLVTDLPAGPLVVWALTAVAAGTVAARRLSP